MRLTVAVFRRKLTVRNNGSAMQNQQNPTPPAFFPSRVSRVRISSSAQTRTKEECGVPVARRHPGSGTHTTLPGRGFGTWATLAPVPARHPASSSGCARRPSAVDDLVRNGGGRGRSSAERGSFIVRIGDTLLTGQRVADWIQSPLNPPTVGSSVENASAAQYDAPHLRRLQRVFW